MLHNGNSHNFIRLILVYFLVFLCKWPRTELFSNFVICTNARGINGVWYDPGTGSGLLVQLFFHFWPDRAPYSKSCDDGLIVRISVLYSDALGQDCNLTGAYCDRWKILIFLRIYTWSLEYKEHSETCDLIFILGIILHFQLLVKLPVNKLNNIEGRRHVWSVSITTVICLCKLFEQYKRCF